MVSFAIQVNFIKTNTMKKTILLVAIILMGAVATFAQDANAILDRYTKETNINSVAPDKQNSLMIELLVKANQGGTNIEIPIKSITQNPGGKLRMEMNMMGQPVLMVVNGKQGWMQMQGQVQALPEAQLKQMSAQGDYLSSMRFDKSKFNLVFVEEKDGMQVVKANNIASPAESPTLFFNKETGLLSKMEMSVNGQTIETIMGDYKNFVGIKIPTQMTVKMGGNEISSITLKSFELDYPTTEFMFAEPK